MSAAASDRGQLFGLSLPMQFMAAAALILSGSMLLLGTYVNQQVTRGVLVSSGAGTVAFLEAVVEPLLRELDTHDSLPPHVHEQLDAVLESGQPILRSVVTLKLWRSDGTVLYANMPKSIIGQKFVSINVAKAALGDVVAEFEDMRSEESAHEQTLGIPLIEVYAPLYDRDRNIVAVGEIYENASVLRAQLRDSQHRTWGVVAVTAICILCLLYLIVQRANNLILRQSAELLARYGEAEAMARMNQQLRIDADEARLNANAANEELIGRVGQDLHDGPIQILSLLMLKLGRLLRSSQTDSEIEYAQSIQDITTEVIKELRSLSTGLVLPEIGEIDLTSAVKLAAERHENLTGTSVELDIQALPDVTNALKICVYRIVQEGLNNAFKHAGGVGQRVAVKRVSKSIELEISDQGVRVGMNGAQANDRATLGLFGIRNRVATFGGEMEVAINERGTSLKARLPVDISKTLNSVSR
ncbi:hypothetical protein JHL21_00030 [Devosia sp. WQ 349]|uniref:sensor histidine kinase n=1 Tax=Devosia sp. WQ 349K1 TaxID=2800329 RepID=UPI001A2BE6F2|nr:histidine kinase [Devosia sp. WQ 349K1]MBK1792880.1 hypothetical protein [Devosia sp. WQ 349K1]